jgi:16S rRNA (cytidine1402-2'-O)-methyltransferase
MSKGILYIIATPIGNMDDISLRAIETLKAVDMVLSEDTRETYKLLKKYNLDKSQVSYRDQNHDRVIKSILELLKDGKNVALVSDSGKPLISDPGYKLVHRLVRESVEIKVIPGPSSVISALVVSGLPTDKFTFVGFLPKTENQREALLKTYGQLDSTMIIFESPNRLAKLMTQIEKSLGNRYVCLVNEQTKVYEKVIRGTAGNIMEKFGAEKIRGEFVVLVAKEDFKI